VNAAAGGYYDYDLCSLIARCQPRIQFSSRKGENNLLDAFLYLYLQGLAVQKHPTRFSAPPARRDSVSKKSSACAEFGREGNGKLQPKPCAPPSRLRRGESPQNFRRI
jgi:hypothetical protein